VQGHGHGGILTLCTMLPIIHGIFISWEARLMSIGSKGICVKILDREFQVACPRDQEQALRDAARYLDAQMRKIRQTGRVIGVERVATMAALNIANELLTLRNSDSGHDRALFSERLKNLQARIDGALATPLPRKEIEMI
jgi:cell division protein ZapA